MAANAQQIASNWQSAMQSPTTANKYRAGINNYQGNPMQAASTPQALQKYAQNTAAAAQPGGKMQTKLANASVATWKANATGPGASNLVTGANKGMAKMQAASATIAQAAAAAQEAAKNATGPMAKVAAAINATRAAWGYSPVA